jgi:hypothetical protein
MKKVALYVHSIQQKWKRIGTHDKIILTATLFYLVVVSAFMIWHQEFFSPDHFFAIAFFGMLVACKTWSFFWDWTPPLLLILGYEYLRGVVPHLTSKVNIYPMMDFDKFVFHSIPTITLQNWFFKDNLIHWYDNIAVGIYFLHFIVPLIVALLFWLVDRRYFKKYMASLIVLSYMAFFTYYIFPAMPPWMASEQGFLPPINHIMSQVLAHFAHPISLPAVYGYIGANLVAAVPSLHAAYPLLTALFLRKKFPRFGVLSFLYPASMWLVIVYLGEHYVFDIVIATIYVLFTYVFITNWRGVGSKIKQKISKLFASPTKFECS